MKSLELVFIGMMQITSYRSVPAQTDSTPYYTSIGEHVHDGGCAVSRDLLHTSLPYGSYVYIEDVGLCKVNDTMHKRMRRHVDLWVPNYAREHEFGVKRKRVYKVKVPNATY